MQKIILLVLITFFMYGCAFSPINSAINITKHPGVGSIGVVDNGVAGRKTGLASCYAILGLFAFGDCSVDAAKKQGGISRVNSVDHSTVNVFYFYSEYKTIVRGE